MKTNVLVIDSNSAVQAIIAAALTPGGIQVHSLTNGASALEHIRKLSPKIVFVSKSLSDSDALALSRALKSDSALKDICVVIMTSSGAEQDYVKEAKKHGVSSVLPKPFKSKEVKKLVEELLSAQKEVSSSPATTQKQGSPSPEGTFVFISLSETYLMEMFTRFFQRFGLSVLTTIEDAKKAKQTHFSVVDTASLSALKENSDADLGELFVVSTNEDAEQNTEGSTLLYRPLSETSLRANFSSYLPPEPLELPRDEAELTAGELSLLSAKISSQVFQRLLLSEPLKQRKWREVAASVGAETLHQCQNWDKER